MSVVSDPGLLLGVGGSLREARLRRGLDLGAIAQATRIRTRHLEAIESGRFETLPGDVYASGFIRAYAAFLGLDPDRHVEEFRRGRLDGNPPVAAPGVLVRARRTRPPLLRLLTGLGLLAVVATVGTGAAILL